MLSPNEVSIAHRADGSLFPSKAYYAARDQDGEGKATLPVQWLHRGYDAEAEYAIIQDYHSGKRQHLRNSGASSQGFRGVPCPMSNAAGVSLANHRRCPSLRRSWRLSDVASKLCASLFFKQSGFSNAFSHARPSHACAPTPPPPSATAAFFPANLRAGCIPPLRALCLLLGSDKIGRRLIVLVRRVLPWELCSSSGFLVLCPRLVFS